MPRRKRPESSKAKRLRTLEKSLDQNARHELGELGEFLDFDATIGPECLAKKDLPEPAFLPPPPSTDKVLSFLV